MARARVKVAIFDNCPVVIRGVQAILSSTGDFEFAGGYTSINELLKDAPPDVLLAEVSIKETNIEQVITTLRKKFPHTKILVFSILHSIYNVKEVMRQGAAGYLLKTSNESEILFALHTVQSGEQYVETSIKESIIQKALLNKKPFTGQPRLTKREKEILQLLASNFSSKEISKKLYISQKTVENHRYNMLLKFKVKNAASLIKKALELDLLDS